MNLFRKNNQKTEVDKKIGVDEFINNGIKALAKFSDEEAIEFYDKALKIEKDNTRALRLKASSLKNLGQYSEALEILNNAINYDSQDERLWFELGDISPFINVSYSNADECFDKALKINPNYADALYGKGKIQYNQENYDKAFNFFSKSLEANSDFYESMIGLGNVLFYKKQYEESIKFYDKVLGKNEFVDRYCYLYKLISLCAMENVKEISKEIEKMQEFWNSYLSAFRQMLKISHIKMYKLDQIKIIKNISELKICTSKAFFLTSSMYNKLGNHEEYSKYKSLGLNNVYETKEDMESVAQMENIQNINITNPIDRDARQFLAIILLQKYLYYEFENNEEKMINTFNRAKELYRGILWKTNKIIFNNI